MATDPRPVIAIGGSAGALDAIFELFEEVPVDLPAPIVVGLHSRPESRLFDSLGMRMPHNLRLIEDGDRIEAATVHVIPPARHVFFRGDGLSVSEEVEDSGFRPSIDALFMTLAASHGTRGVGIVLSGLLQDGMRGAQVLYDVGARTLVQDPDGAKFDEMPLSVIRNDHPDAVLPPKELGRWIARTVAAV